MAYQGTADIVNIAEDVRANVINGNWSDAVALVRSLNGSQGFYLSTVIQRYKYLTLEQHERLLLIASNSMNDGETGLGYIAENQETEDEPIEAEDWWTE